MAFEEFRTQELEGWDERAEAYVGVTARVTTQAIPALLASIRTRVGIKVLDFCTGRGFAAGTTAIAVAATMVAATTVAAKPAAAMHCPAAISAASVGIRVLAVAAWVA